MENSPTLIYLAFTALITFGTSVITWLVKRNANLEKRIEDAIRNPKNLGEMESPDAVGTVGSPDCGDMLRMWVKFKEQDGKKVIVWPDDLAPGLVASAVSPHQDGELVEGLEGDDPEDWLVGVQFHPERPEFIGPEFDRLWHAFVDAARVRSGRRRRS